MIYCNIMYQWTNYGQISQMAVQLEAVARAFLTNCSRNQYNATTGRLKVSKIFDGYREDFDFEGDGQCWHKLDQFFVRPAESLADIPEAKVSVISGVIKLRLLDCD